jgi:hypothetical protein
MTKQFTIYYNNKSIVLKNKEIIDMELKLNLSPWSRNYSTIGDDLYKYFIGVNNKNHIFLDSHEQFINFKFLSEKTYDEYKNEIYAMLY